MASDERISNHVTQPLVTAAEHRAKQPFDSPRIVVQVSEKAG